MGTWCQGIDGILGVRAVMVGILGVRALMVGYTWCQGSDGWVYLVSRH